MITVNNGVPDPKLKEAVIFPFDDVTVPFTAGLQLHLNAGKIPGVPNPIVLDNGPAGAPDDKLVRFYGTIIPIDGELKMWYMANGNSDEDNNMFGAKLCYATSKDGYDWEKPNLGLVEYNGNKNNNIINFLTYGKPKSPGISAAPVMYDPDDADPNRRFKSAFESGFYGNCISVGFSADGLNWTDSNLNPVAPMLEQTGLIKFNGCYFVNGQGGRHFGQGRKLVTFASYDFEHWTQASCMGLRRDNLPPRPMKYEWNASEEVHLGAGLWDRGNVIIGVYDMWHGAATSDRADVTMDLGLAITNDALHYREPIPDFKFVPSYEEIDGVRNTLSHGQGMFNIGDKTMLWYETWGASHGIRLATWERDRIGHFQKFDYRRRPAYLPPDGIFIDVDPHFITCPFTLDDKTTVYANADGLGQYGELKVEVLTKEFIPIPSLSGENSIPLKKSGLREKISWKNTASLDPSLGQIRLKVTSSGVRPEDVKIFALYLAD